jgi:hypothetical protein
MPFPPLVNPEDLQRNAEYGAYRMPPRFSESADVMDVVDKMIGGFGPGNLGGGGGLAVPAITKKALLEQIMQPRMLGGSYVPKAGTHDIVYAAAKGVLNRTKKSILDWVEGLYNVQDPNAIAQFDPVNRKIGLAKMPYYTYPGFEPDIASSLGHELGHAGIDLVKARLIKRYGTSPAANIPEFWGASDQLPNIPSRPSQATSLLQHLGIDEPYTHQSKRIAHAVNMPHELTAESYGRHVAPGISGQEWWNIPDAEVRAKKFLELLDLTRRIRPDSP